MPIGIKATNSRDLRVISCTFSGLDTDIELDNVQGFTSINNRFSQNDLQVILNSLYKEILNSNLSENDKKVLLQEAIYILSDRSNFRNGKDQNIKQKLLQLIGNKALDYFVQLATAVSAGLIVRKI